VLTGFYEDFFGHGTNDPLARYIAAFAATRALEPAPIYV
jgi:hypothetical protein